MADTTAIAKAVMAGENDSLWLFIYDYLHRPPETVAECEAVIDKMPADDLRLYLEN